MKIYFIPGLGFDNRIFETLGLNGPDFKFLNWIEPKENERIREYAFRFSNRIEHNLKGVTLIGHSFGGIIAQEISVLIPIKKIILISSIKSREELPLHFKVVKPLYIHKLFSKKLTEKTIKYWGKIHDYGTSEEQSLIKDMVDKHSNNYLQWALKELSIWDKPEIPFNTKIFQIHGKTDKTFPFKLIKHPDKIIKKAGHFMVYKQSKLIAKIIKDELKNKNES